MNKQDREHIDKLAVILNTQAMSMGVECITIALKNVYEKGEIEGHQFAIDMMVGKKEAI